MKYTGRIFGMFVGLTLITFHYLLEGSLDIYYFILLILASTLIWWFGKQYDKAKYYFKESQKTQENLQQIFDSVEATIWSMDLRTKTELVSAGIERIYGFRCQDFFDNINLWKDVVHPDDKNIANEMEKELLSGKISKREYRIIRPNGEIRCVQRQATPIFNSVDKLIKINGVTIDITKQKLTEEKLKESENHYRNLVEIFPQPIVIHQKSKIIYVNPAAYKAIGSSNLEALIGKSIYDFIHSDYREIVTTRLKKDLDVSNKNLIEMKMIKLDGQVINAEVSSFEISYMGNPAILNVLNDITERKQAEEKINHMAFHDALTDLPNRRQLSNYLKKLLVRSNSINHKIGFMFIDLDQFKAINDKLGHRFGDVLLKQVSIRLKKCLRQNDIIFRFGGDEFIIILNDINQEAVSRVAQRIIADFNYPFMVNGHKVFTSSSIGISIYPTDGEDEETLIKNADSAMYFAKEQGKNNFQFYSSNLNDMILRK